MQKVKAFVKSHVIDNIKQWHKLATVRFWIIVGVFAQLADVILPYSMMLDPNAVIGKLEGNPIYHDQVEGTEMCRPSFLIK